jgi:mono/diheme cytochrome c family protein
MLGLSKEQVDMLTFYTLSLRRSYFPEAFWPQDRIRAERFGEREFATDGATLFGTFCAACHGPKGEGLRYPGTTPFPAIGNPDFLSVASDQLIAETIRQGRPGRRMPAWSESEGGLRSEEIQSLVSYIRSLGGAAAQPIEQPAERRWITADANHGLQLYGRFCAGCHGANGEGTQAPALNNPVLLANASDTYFVETIGRGRRGTEMLGFREASPIRPALEDDEIEAIVAFIRTWELPNK